MVIENNTNLSGDEARLLLQAMFSKGISYPGDIMPMAFALYQKLFQLHLNQPSEQKS